MEQEVRSSENKRFMTIVVVLCLMFAADRLFNFGYEHWPIASPGECIQITLPSMMKVQFKVIANDSVSGASTLQYDGMNMKTDVSYEQLRELSAVKVKCNENSY